jgi:hypothetical protein
MARKGGSKRATLIRASIGYPFLPVPSLSVLFESMFLIPTYIAPIRLDRDKMRQVNRPDGRVCFWLTDTVVSIAE